MVTDKQCLVALNSFSDFGPVRVSLLISFFGGAKKAWQASCKELVKIGLKENLVKKFDNHRKNFDFRGYFSRLERLGVKIVTKFDKDYPENLLEIEDAPLVLYVLGNLKPSDRNAISIVGARKMTSYGREVATKFAGELASLGITIVSGLALGIDSVAHKAALEVGGRSIAVIASGIDQITPHSNYYLAREIIKKDGAILSEFPLGAKIWRSSFAIRNRIVSGLSKALVVIEGTQKSGTLLTASHAANQGRTVFAVPGQITSPMTEATHFLIRNGAKIAFSVKDILDELNLQVKVDRDALDSTFPKDKIEGEIYEILSREPLHLDEIARISGLKVAEVSGKLTVMELKGMVKNIGNGVYKKV